MDSKANSDQEIATTSRNSCEDGMEERAVEGKSKTSRQGDPAADIKAEKVCRICHFGVEPSKELIPIGCDCRGDLGISHLACAEAWFLHRRNRLCEICGKTASNINSHGNNIEGTQMFVIDLNEMGMVLETVDGSQEDSRDCKRLMCNLMLGFLVLAFTVPWFIRGKDIF